MNILLVEDDPDVRNVTVRLLELLNCRVVAVADASKAITKIVEKSNDFDLVMTDYFMPDMDGIELTKNLKRIIPDLPVILCTGINNSTDDEIISESGITEILSKPYTKNDLDLSIRRATAR